MADEAWGHEGTMLDGARALFAQSAGRTDGMIWTGLGSPYSMDAPVERVTDGTRVVGPESV